MACHSKNIKQLVNVNELLDDRDNGLAIYAIAKKYHIGFQRAKAFFDDFDEKEKYMNSIYGEHKWRFVTQEELKKQLIKSPTPSIQKSTTSQQSYEV